MSASWLHPLSAELDQLGGAKIDEDGMNPSVVTAARKSIVRIRAVRANRFDEDPLSDEQNLHAQRAVIHEQMSCTRYLSLSSSGSLHPA
jgi:hypothetical protein